MKSLAPKLLLSLLAVSIPFTSVINATTCKCKPSPPGATLTCVRRGDIAVCGDQDSGVCKAMCYSVESIAAPQRIPSIWPLEREATNSYSTSDKMFDDDSSEIHPGADIPAPRGTPVFAPADGVVVKAGWQRAYGQTVVIDHSNGLTTRYGHLSKLEVAVGQELKRGEELGKVGSTGRSNEPHLHYEVRLENTPVNPLNYLPTRQ